MLHRVILCQNFVNISVSQANNTEIIQKFSKSEKRLLPPDVVIFGINFSGVSLLHKIRSSSPILNKIEQMEFDFEHKLAY